MLARRRKIGRSFCFETGNLSHDKPHLHLSRVWREQVAYDVAAPFIKPPQHHRARASVVPSDRGLPRDSYLGDYNWIAAVSKCKSNSCRKNNRGQIAISEYRHISKAFDSTSTLSLLSRTLRPHQPVFLVPTATWLTSAIPVPAAEQTTNSLLLKLEIVANSTKSSARISKLLHVIGAARPSTGATAISTMTLVRPDGSASSSATSALPANANKSAAPGLFGDACSYKDVGRQDDQQLAHITT